MRCSGRGRRANEGGRTVGPAPRRRAVEGARVQRVLVTPDEAAAIEQPADELQFTELTLTIDRFHGERDGHTEAPGPRHQTKPKT
jgi:hypothetical protein